MHDGKHQFVDVEAHPTIDELFLVYDTGGWVKIFDVVTEKCVWEAREKNFYRDIGDVRPSHISQCLFSDDG